MRKVLIISLGVFSFLLFSTLARYIYVCEIKGNCDTGTVRLVENNKPFSLALKNGADIIVEGYQQLSFEPKSSIPALSPNNEAFLDKVAAYMKAHPDLNLTITGLYRASEHRLHAGMLENLGLGRADALRKLLVKRGIDANRIDLDYEMSEDEDLKESARFDLYAATPASYEEDGGIVKAQFRFNDMTFSDANFEFNSDVFKPGDAFQIWADSVQTYFNIYPDKSLKIIGHTDYYGSNQYNQGLGARRAVAAKAYFEKKGLKASIVTSSNGEKTPIANNATEIGRQKNRRVQFIIE